MGYGSRDFQSSRDGRNRIVSRLRRRLVRVHGCAAWVAVFGVSRWRARDPFPAEPLAFSPRHSQPAAAPADAATFKRSRPPNGEPALLNTMTLREALTAAAARLAQDEHLRETAA